MNKLETIKKIKEKLKNRVYAEQGIPVFLMLEDLTDDSAKFSSIDPFEDEVIANLIERFEKILVKDKTTELTESDISKIIEAVASRYFIMSSTNS